MVLEMNDAPDDELKVADQGVKKLAAGLAIAEKKKKVAELIEELSQTTDPTTVTNGLNSLNKKAMTNDKKFRLIIEAEIHRRRKFNKQLRTLSQTMKFDLYKEENRLLCQDENVTKSSVDLMHRPHPKVVNNVDVEFMKQTLNALQKTNELLNQRVAQESSGIMNKMLTGLNKMNDLLDQRVAHESGTNVRANVIVEGVLIQIIILAISIIILVCVGFAAGRKYQQFRSHSTEKVVESAFSSTASTVLHIPRGSVPKKGGLKKQDKQAGSTGKAPKKA